MGDVVGVCPCLGQYLIKFWRLSVKMTDSCMAGVPGPKKIVKWTVRFAHGPVWCAHACTHGGVALDRGWGTFGGHAVKLTAFVKEKFRSF